MKSKGTYNYCIVNFKTKQELDVNLTDYCILEKIHFYSNKNELKLNMTKFSRLLGIDRKTYLEHIKNLSIKGHIGFDEPILSKKTKNCRIDAEIAAILEDSMLEASNDYLKIYFKHAKELRINLSNYALLYLGYSIPRKNQDKAVRASNSYLAKRIDLKEGSLFKAKVKLEQQGLITRVENGNFVLKKHIHDWFKKQESISR